MPRSPIASRTSSSLNGLMMAMTSFMESCRPRGRSPAAGLAAPLAPNCARSGGPDQAQMDARARAEPLGGSTHRPALPDQSLLRDRGDQRAVAGEDQPARQSARAGKIGAVLGV